MYTFLKNFRMRDALLADLPAFAASLLVAELFYKFGSFTLECLAFLATWCAVSFVLAGLVRLTQVRKKTIA